MAAPTRDPITCHVLDTTTGRPGPNISVRLLCIAQPDTVFHATTNEDGRIALWSKVTTANDTDVAFTKPNMIRNLIREKADGKDGTSTWKLEFDTGSYYGEGKTFFPKVELSFLAKDGEHFHVPLLLGPYSFTTYRGS